MVNIKYKLYKPLQDFISRALKEVNLIPLKRQEELAMLAAYIRESAQAGKKAELVFICTHNSRRSHISQIWAQAIALYNGQGHVITYSGGTEATAFNLRAVKAMETAGFKILTTRAGENPLYEVWFSNDFPPLEITSKVYDAPCNPNHDFCAVMTCSHANENCPFIPGATSRIALTYDDPKDFDGTVHEAAKYTDRVNQIGRELVYAFSLIRT